MATELPEGLTVIDSDTCAYRYTEGFGSFTLGARFVDFTILSGTREVEVWCTSTAPIVPVDVLRFIVAEADRLKGRS